MLLNNGVDNIMMEYLNQKKIKNVSLIYQIVMLCTHGREGKLREEILPNDSLFEKSTNYQDLEKH